MMGSVWEILRYGNHVFYHVKPDIFEKEEVLLIIMAQG